VWWTHFVEGAELDLYDGYALAPSRDVADWDGKAIGACEGRPPVFECMAAARNSSFANVRCAIEDKSCMYDAMMQ
jgi:hypothetical protein